MRNVKYMQNIKSFKNGEIVVRTIWPYHHKDKKWSPPVFLPFWEIWFQTIFAPYILHDKREFSGDVHRLYYIQIWFCSNSPRNELIYWGGGIIIAILRVTFSYAFIKWKSVFRFHRSAQWSNHYLANNGTDNDLPNRQKAINWVNHDLVYWCI